jgi:hypothetical protein
VRARETPVSAVHVRVLFHRAIRLEANVGPVFRIAVASVAIALAGFAATLVQVAAVLRRRGGLGRVRLSCSNRARAWGPVEHLNSRRAATVLFLFLAGGVDHFRSTRATLILRSNSARVLCARHCFCFFNLFRIEKKTRAVNAIKKKFVNQEVPCTHFGAFGLSDLL